MSQVILKNETITVTIDTAGAEMTSIRSAAGKEYLWSGDPQYWKRHAPVLFPLVGSVWNKEFRVGDQTYAMGQHGFARDMEFELTSATETEAWFRLTSSEETLAKYPYEFILDIGYRLGENSVENIWRVTNPAQTPLDFSIGGHPAFVCPQEEGEKQTDYRLWFDTTEPMTSAIIRQGGCVSDEKKTIVTEDGYLPIDAHLFDDDALIIEYDQCHQVALVNPAGQKYLTVSFTAPLFGVWSCPGKNAPFVCIEPWYGRCDAMGYEGQWKDRTWGNTLQAGETFEGAFTVEIA